MRGTRNTIAGPLDQVEGGKKCISGGTKQAGDGGGYQSVLNDNTTQKQDTKVMSDIKHRRKVYYGRCNEKDLQVTNPRC